METNIVRWLEYLKENASNNKVIAQALTNYYLENISLEEMEQQVTESGDILTIKTFEKKLKIDELLGD